MNESEPGPLLARMFELRYRNLLSISKAQKVHLTALLIQMTLLWTWYFSGGRSATLQGIALTDRGIWLVSPAVLTFFCLVFIGSINAALPARKKLEELGMLQSELACKFSFYDLDTDKNVLDYLTFLKISSSNNNFDQVRRYDVRNFLYPFVVGWCFVTTVFALAHLPRMWATFVYAMVCMILQTLYARRSFSRAWRRFRGQDVDQ